MLEIKNLSIGTILGKPLISGLDLVLNDEDRIAVIGEEGRGKSTLLKAIYNSKEVEKYCYISGQISKDDLIIGYLEQSLNIGWDDEYVYEFFLKDSPEEEVKYENYERLKDASRELSRLGISPDILQSERLVGTLSGGEKVKVQIAKLLMQNPDILLLDEPTNDLDIETLEWLEDFIVNSNIPILFISHDETLLEGTANIILHLEYVKTKKKARHTLQKGDYRSYVEDREREIENREREFKREHREFKKDKQILSREKSRVRTAQIKIKDSAVRRILNKQMKNILTKERMAEEKLETEKLETEDPIYFSFNDEVEIPNGKRILDLSLDELKVGDKVLARDIELNVVGPTKVAIIGENGIGKTTLLREIHKRLESRDDINVGYMPQDYADILDDEDIVLEYLISDLEEVDLDLVTAYMGRIKLNWDEMNGKVGDLSYGQKAKLMILKMMLDRKDVLLLDEPTRNLSALSNPVVRKVLNDFKGSIISISHDRKFLKEVCDKVYRLEKTGISTIEIK
jgi:ATPase subunit of ABC transporter with duplicated ATPase domains